MYSKIARKPIILEINFTVTPGQIPVDDVIIGVEGGPQGLTGSDSDKAQIKIAGVLMSAKPFSSGPFGRPLMT